MRFAGTCRRYSKSAMPQLASAAIHHGQAARFFRCAYQAKVMNTFEATSSAADTKTGETCINRSLRRPGPCTFQAMPWPGRVPESPPRDQSPAGEEARKRARASADGEFSVLENPR